MLIERINRQEANKSKIEVDIAYLTGAIRDKKYDVPVMERLYVLAENTSGLIIDQDFVFPDDNEMEVIFGMTVNYILVHQYARTLFFCIEIKCTYDFIFLQFLQDHSYNKMLLLLRLRRRFQILSPPRCTNF
ncbi:MAG: hypothetical protein PWQ59_2305 [Thermoanaerobacterium sp.]|uniref:DUF6930 domain-containing protein n=1 Tax=Thermoanaerobacterium TaxID=28895 RepID=UPI0024ABC0AC|nr:hypothetical protein [Thermoanaerobacterium sp.]